MDVGDAEPPDGPEDEVRGQARARSNLRTNADGP